MFNRNKQFNSNQSAEKKPAEFQQAVVQSADTVFSARDVSNRRVTDEVAAHGRAVVVSAADYKSQPKREENTIAILVDEDSGIEYYMETIDIFAVDGRLYVAMFPVPEKKQMKSPQLVLLRIVSGEGQAGQTMYESIRDKRELARVFDAFFARYENSFLMS